jgi:PAS domain S-box-containing protein
VGGNVLPQIIIVAGAFIAIAVVVFLISVKRDKKGEKKSVLQYWPALLVLTLGLSVSGVSYSWVRNIEHNRVKEKFVERVEGVSSAFEIHLVSYEHTLKILKAIFLASNYIDEDEYEILSAGVLLSRPDIKGVYFIPRIVDNLEMLPLPFWYTENNLKYGVTSPEQGALIIQRSASLDYFRSLTGLNIGHYRNFKDAIEQSFIENKVVASMPTNLFSDMQGVFLYYPLFQKSNVDTLDEHYKNIMLKYNADVGFLSLNVKVDEFFIKEGEFEDINIDLHLLDEKGLSVHLFSNRGSKEHDGQHEKKEEYTDTVEIFSKKWKLTYSPTEKYALYQVKKQHIILISGVLLSLFAAIYIATTIQQKEKDTLLTAALEKERAYLKNIMDNMMQGVVTIDKTGAINTINKWAEQIFGYTSEEVLTKNVTDLLPYEYRDKHQTGINQYIETGTTTVVGKDLVTKGLRKNGDIFPMSLNIMEIKGLKPLTFIGLTGDISERIKRETELKQAMKMAEEASVEKSNFLAKMSHELRTPLNSIIGMSRMLFEDNTLNYDNQSMAKTVNKSSQNLLEIVNDILDISKIEAGGLILENIGFDLKEIVSNVIDAMAPMASEKGINLKCSYNDENIPYILGDPLRVGRIITNLVGNSIKYTNQSDEENPTQNVDVLVDAISYNDDEVEISLQVTDTGIGIAPTQIKRIFERFSQADASITRKYGGTGLGLSITKDLVEKMNGTIGVQSEVGEGSVFWVKIPFKITDHTHDDVKTEKQRNLRKCVSIDATPAVSSVLIAEDHILNQELIKRFIARMGFGNYRVVENGKLAVDAFEEEEYDLILMDCHMPQKNGYEATHAIRQSKKKSGKTIPIIALTADAMEGTREKCLKAGMTDYMSKPIDLDRLYVVLSQWINFEKNIEEKDLDGEVTNQGTFLDLSILEEYTDSAEETKELINLYLQQSDLTLKTLEDNCVDGESIAWSEAAHKQKGGSVMIGANALSALCATGQEMVDSSASERRKLLDAILTEYQTVKKILTEY